MLLSLNWLKKYVDIEGISVDELAEKITLSGLEVEKVYSLSEATGCVIGHVLEKQQHPNADKLSICLVNLGTEVKQIICGAKNVDKDQKVIVAKVGSVLPGGLKIKKAKLRGEESNGMICSLKELGIEKKLVPDEFEDGIMVLSEDAEVGMDAIKYLGLDDTIFDIDITPDRSDCLSVLGIAYQVAAIFDKEIKKPFGENLPYSIDKNFKIKIESEDCSLYYAKIIRNIIIKQSPEWLQSLLIASGIRPINNVVDITNFVMLELGQPLHSFDFNKLNSHEILVRNANKNETIVTLDDQKRQLVETDLVITDGKVPIALAGVMGGSNTEIDDNTTTVLLESAVFKPLTIRKTYKRLDLRSEASMRYEKQVDPSRTEYALNRACQLLVDIANGKIDNQLSMASNIDNKEKKISISVDKINKVLGIQMKQEEVADIFRRLRFEFVQSDNSFIVNIPSRRPDIIIEEDLIEDIIQIYGYYHLNNTLPQTDSVGALTERQKSIRKIKRTLLGAGLNEVITYSLINEKDIYRFVRIKNELKKAISLEKPMSEEHGVLRIGLIHSLLDVVRYNNARNINDVLVFEMSKGFSMNNNQVEETLLLSGACTGVIQETKWQKEKESVDFFYVKGILELIFERLNILDQISFIPVTKDVGEDFHPTRSAYILLNEKQIGIVGEVHPNTEKEYDLKETYVFELELDALLDLEIEENLFTSISKYPTMTRDIALVVDSTINADTLKNAIIDKGKNILKSVEIFDVYEGEHIEQGKKSIAFSLTFENIDKTLTDEEVNKAYDRILSHLENEYSAHLRK